MYVSTRSIDPALQGCLYREILKPKTDEDQEQVDNDNDESIMNRNREARIKEQAATSTAVNGQQLDENEDNAAIVLG